MLGFSNSGFGGGGGMRLAAGSDRGICKMNDRAILRLRRTIIVLECSIPSFACMISSAYRK